MAAVGQSNLLSKSVLAQINKLCQDRSGRVKLNKTLRTIHNEFEFGNISIDLGYLRYTHTELEALTQEVTQLFGSPKWRESLNLDGNRHQMAQITHSEKLAKQSPNCHKVLFMPSNNQLQSLGLSQPPQYSLRLNWQQIPACQRILIVENLDSFDTIRSYQLPDELQDIPVLYRGDNIDIHAVKRFIAEKPQLAVIWFGDWDPAGLMLAQQYHATHILWPQHFDTMIGSAAKFTQQSNQQVSLNRLSASPLQQLWQQLKQAKSAYMQQQTLAHTIPLKLVELS